MDVSRIPPGRKLPDEIAVPNTLAEDGGPVDVVVVGRMPVLPGAVLRVRPIGVLEMQDEAGMDEKILGTQPSERRGPST